MKTLKIQRVILAILVDHFIGKSNLDKIDLLIELLWHTANIISDNSLVYYFKEEGLHSTIIKLVQQFRDSLPAEVWRLVIWIMQIIGKVLDSVKEKQQFTAFVKDTSPKLLQIAR